MKIWDNVIKNVICIIISGPSIHNASITNTSLKRFIFQIKLIDILTCVKIWITISSTMIGLKFYWCGNDFSPVSTQLFIYQKIHIGLFSLFVSGYAVLFFTPFIQLTLTTKIFFECIICPEVTSPYPGNNSESIGRIWLWKKQVLSSCTKSWSNLNVALGVLGIGVWIRYFFRAIDARIIIVLLKIIVGEKSL